MLTEKKYYLGDGPSGLNDFFPLHINYMKVTRRYPQTGTPQSIDVELQTGHNWGYLLRYPFDIVSCANAIVVARDPASKAVLGSAHVNTSVPNSCVGTGRIALDFSTLSVIPKSINIEAYEETVDVSNIASYTPLKSISVPIDVSYRSGLQTGVYSSPTQESLLGSLFSGGINLRGATIFLVVLGGTYLVWKNGDNIKKLFTKATS